MKKSDVKKFELTEFFKFRCTQNDVEMLKKLAKKSGISKSEWVRRIIFREWTEQFKRGK